MDLTKTNNAEGKLVSIGRFGLEDVADQSNTRKYTVVAVHGLGNIGDPDSAWSLRQDEETTIAWLTELLPLHVGCADIMAYNYSILQINEGISTVDLRSLAEQLLEEIFLAKFDKSKKFVFFGHDLGGLIIKEVLFIAGRNKKYQMIAGNTALLVFFETPHRSASERSWESLANWLLLVSGKDHLFSLSWIQVTAGMMKSACTNFGRSERLYRVMNIYCKSISPSYNPRAEGTGWLSLDESSATLGTPKELKKTRDKPHGRICTFSSEADPALELLYKEINASSRPGLPLIECLETLASISDSQLHDSSSPILYNRTSPETLDVLDNHPDFCQWTKSSNGPFHIIVPLGDDSSLVFSKLQTAPMNIEENSKSAIISYTFSPRTPERNNETALLASLCYQLLCLKPELFEHVATLNDSLQDFSIDRYWQVHRLFILFRSLLSCPLEGETTCVLREMDYTKLPKGVLSQLLLLATSDGSKFKLIIISANNDNIPSKIPTICLEPEKFNLEAILDYELDNLILNRPGLLMTRSTLRAGLLTQHNSDPGLFIGFFDVVAVAVRTRLELILKMAEPVSISSITRSLDLMPKKNEDVYKSILERMPLQNRPKMRTILSWLALSKWPLEVAELTTISALEHEIQTTDALFKNMPVNLSGDLQTVFGPIIQIDANKHLLLPAEFRAFLISGHGKNKTLECDKSCVFCLDGELELAQNCLEFLRLHREEDPTSLFASKNKPPFIVYAVRCWAVHYVNGKKAILQPEEEESSMPSNFLDFFQDRKLMNFWANMYNIIQHPSNKYSNGNIISMAAEVGCLDLVNYLLSLMNLDKEEDATALSRGLAVAISGGDPKIVKAFIAAKASSSLAFHAAASSGKWDLVVLLKELRNSKDSLEAKDMQGFTQLHCACRSGALEVVDGLLHAGADAKAQSSNEEMTPLHIACMFGHAAVIKRLKVLKDLDLNAKDKYNRTPLYYACKWQQPDAVRALLEYPKGQEIKTDIVDSNSTTSALHLAASEGRIDILKLILDNSYPSEDAAEVKTTNEQEDNAGEALNDKIQDVSSKESNARVQNLLSLSDESLSTALHFAARDGHFEVAKELIRLENPEKPVAILTEDEKGNLPIHLASKNGHVKIVERLLEKTDLVHKQLYYKAHGEEYALPIHLAVSHDRSEVVRILAKKEKASLDFFDGKQRSPLHLAATRGQIDITRLLIKYEATPDILDYNDATPLLLACHSGQEAVASFLVEKGADINISNEKGLCPLVAAINARKFNLALLLLERGAKTDVADSTKTTPLLAAALVGNIPIMEALRYSRTAWAATDDQGRNALHLAVESGNNEAVEFVFLQDRNLVDKTDQKRQTPLHYAVEHGSPLATRDDIYDNKNIRFFNKDRSGKTPLELVTTEDMLKKLLTKLLESNDFHQAADFEELRKNLVRLSVQKGYAETIKMLMDKDTMPKEIDDKRRTLLHLAALAGHQVIVEYLVNDAKVSPDAKDDDGRTALSLAAEEGYLEIVKFLAQKTPTGKEGADSQGNSPLFHASGAGHLDVVSFLLDDVSPDVDSKDLSVVNTKKRGPLWAAVSHDREDVVELLLQRGADPRIVEEEDLFTLLHCAVWHDSLAVIDLLLKDGRINGHALDRSGQTPIFIAAYQGKREMVSKLIEADWVGNFAQYYWKWYPLHAAYDRDDILQLLIDRAKMDVDRVDKDGSTALHLAARGFYDSVRVLLEHGANPLLPDDDGTTPLHMAAQYAKPDTVQLILNKALSKRTNSEKIVSIPNLKDNRGRSAFLAAVVSGNPAVVELFLETKIFDPLETANGDTAIELAREKNSPKIVAMLLRSNGSAFKLDTLRRALVWAVQNKSIDSDYGSIETELIKLLQNGKTTELWEDEELLQLIWDTEDIPLAKLLQCHNLGKMAAKRDIKHRWTLEQLIEAFEPNSDKDAKSEKDEAASQKDRPLPPSQWDMNRKADCVKAVKPEKDRPVLWIKHEPPEPPSSSSLGSMMSNHPAPPSQKYYFEITVKSGSEYNLRIGFGPYDSGFDRMPGIEDGTWGLHGDNGRIYIDGWGRERSDEWKYGTGDVVGVCVDTRTQTAFFTKNGKLIDAGFSNLSGRIFPMIGLGVDAAIEANFGDDLKANPFKYPKGKNMEYDAINLIR